MRMSYTKSWSSIRAILTVCMAVTLVLAPVHPIRAMPQPQQTSNPSNKKKQDKIKAAQAGKQKAAARKAVTGRDHQGNHDSLTKPTKKGAKGDKHMNGVKQSGAAGSSNN